MLAALVVIAVAAWIAWHSISGTKPAAGTANPAAVAATVNIGGPFRLTDHRGNRVTEASFRGRYMLIYFGYGFCLDVCPAELATMAAALDRLGDEAESVQPIFITVDPARDTPEFLREYVARFHPRLTGLTGSPDEIAAAAKVYMVYYARAKSADNSDYLMDHTSFVYLMGPDGRYRTMFRRDTDPREMASKIGKFLAAGAGS